MIIIITMRIRVRTAIMNMSIMMIMNKLLLFVLGR